MYKMEQITYLYTLYLRSYYAFIGTFMSMIYRWKYIFKIYVKCKM